uniref:Peptidase M13 C-terminal domain-containing protein n=1 Tax=Timspurckia oligopyrenoides TaxID=708627 RepID=A0A7S0ZB42_9RHOD
MVEAHFGFHGKILNGQKTLDEQWKRALAKVESMIGDELGKLYVAKHFPLEKQKTCFEMIDNLKCALRDTLTELPWMSDSTKVQAHEKFERFGVKIGVPEEWHEIDGLWKDGIGPETSLTDLSIEYAQWDWETQEVAKFYTPPERKKWSMTPQTVNAYYSPRLNEIVFPAGILQMPFFGYDTFEENIGAIGVVIGHEMTHGFDDEGRKYNAYGELKDWWTAEDGAEFMERARAVEEHYAQQEYFGKKVNGKLTLGENIADIGGIKLALRALRKHYNGNVSKETYERFFRAYALIWRMMIREEMAMKLLTIDPHSPSKFRINSALAHIEEFIETFDVKPNDGMYLSPERRMKIW